MDPVAFWKQIDAGKTPPEGDIVAFLSLDNATLAKALLKAIALPPDVSRTKQVLDGLEWGLPRELDRVRAAIDKPQAAAGEASEGFEDIALGEEEYTYAERAAQELLIFKGMVRQRLRMVAAGAIDELRSVLERR